MGENTAIEDRINSSLKEFARNLDIKKVDVKDNILIIESEYAIEFISEITGRTKGTIRNHLNMKGYKRGINPARVPLDKFYGFVSGIKDRDSKQTNFSSTKDTNYIFLEGKYKVKKDQKKNRLTNKLGQIKIMTNRGDIKKDEIPDNIYSDAAINIDGKLYVKTQVSDVSNALGIDEKLIRNNTSGFLIDKDGTMLIPYVEAKGFYKSLIDVRNNIDGDNKERDIVRDVHAQNLEKKSANIREIRYDIGSKLSDIQKAYYSNFLLESYIFDSGDDIFTAVPSKDKLSFDILSGTAVWKYLKRLGGIEFEKSVIFCTDSLIQLMDYKLGLSSDDNFHFARPQKLRSKGYHFNFSSFELSDMYHFTREGKEYSLISSAFTAESIFMVSTSNINNKKRMFKEHIIQIGSGFFIDMNYFNEFSKMLGSGLRVNRQYQ